MKTVAKIDKNYIVTNIFVIEDEQNAADFGGVELPENAGIGDMVFPDKQAEIAYLKSLLAATDYKAIKYAEGCISTANYREIGNQRQKWRDRINELEAEIESESEV